MKKTNKFRTAALKAWKTIRARKAFNNKYAKTASIAKDLIQGYSSSMVVYRQNTTAGTVAAVLANLRRPGAYRNMAAACKY